MRLLSLDTRSPIKAMAAGVVIVACVFALGRFCNAASLRMGPRAWPSPRDPAPISEYLCYTALTPLLWIAAGGVVLLLVGLALVRWGGASTSAGRFAAAALLLVRTIALFLLGVTLVTWLGHQWLDLSRW